MGFTTWTPPAKNTKKYRVGFLVMRSHFGSDKERTKALDSENDIEILKEANARILEQSTSVFTNTDKVLSYARRIERKIKQLESNG